MSSPLVSVIVITYNQEKTLPLALDSILSQECPFEYEIIVGEDCSPDNTRGVLADYAERYPGIVKPVYQTENQGILKNFISCIDLAKGRYIAFCDGDDYWIRPDKLSQQVSILENQEDVGLVYTDVMMVSKITGEEYYREMCPPREELFTQLLEGNIIVSSSACIKTSLLDYVDFGEFVQQQFSMEDYPLWLSLSLHTKFHYLREATIAYVIEREVVNARTVGLHAIRFDEGTTKIRLYFKAKYPDRTALSKEEIEDVHAFLAVRAGLNMNDRRFTLRYVRMIHRQTAYTRRLKVMCQSVAGFYLYQFYRRLAGKRKTQLQQYFGM